MRTEFRKEQAQTIKKRFERDAAAFDAIYGTQHEFSGWFNRVFRKPIFERYNISFEVMGDLHGKSLLDVGCGSGIYSIEAALKGAERVKGVDFSAPMLAIAKKRAQDQHVETKCEFELKDFLQTDGKEQFTYSIAMGVFDYLSDPVTFLKKLKSVTKDKIIASFPSHSLVRKPLRQLRYLLTAKGQVFFYSRDDIANLANTVGFRHVEIRPMQTGSGFVLIAQV